MAEIFRPSLYGPRLRIEDGFLYYEGPSAQPFAVPMDRFGSAVSQHDGSGNVLRILDANGIELAKGHVPDDWVPEVVEWVNNISQKGKPGGISSLHQLPPPPADFTGRGAELDELLPRFASGGVTISGLRGMGGVGKTALALVLAQRLTPNYPDAQIYLDLKGTSPQPLTAAEAMLHVVRAYRPDVRPPESEAELAGLYHSALHGQRALLLMDNAAGPQQVAPLAPPPGCALLVTSRHKFTLPGLFAVDLDVLPPQDARALLLAIAPRIGDRAGALAQRCEGLPLALRLAANALANHPDLAVEDYLIRLSDAQKRLELVEASLSLSYDLLPPERQGLFAALAAFPGGFDVLAAAAVWDIEQGPAGEALSGLAAASLMEWDPAEGGRYRLHDLVRDFADDRLSAESRAAAARRHAGHYLAVAAACDALYLQGGDAVVSALARFDLEWGNIGAGQAFAMANAGDDSAAAELCMSYPDAGLYCLILRLHPRERVRWLEAALGAARRWGRRGTEGADLGNLGIAYAALGEPRRAIEYLEKALIISRETGYRRGEGQDLGNLGLVYADLGEPRHAIEYHQQALAILREIGDRRGEGNALGNLGSAYFALGETRRAIELYEQALAIDREIGDRRGEGGNQGSLGVAYAALGETRRAVEYYEQQLVITQEIGDRRGEGNALGNLGVAYAALGEARRAIEHYEQALAIDREIGDRRSEGGNLGNLGLAYAALGETSRAIEIYEQILVIHREIGDRRGEGQDLDNLGNAYAALGETSRAIEHYEQALAISREIGNRRGEGIASWNLGLALEREGDPAGAAAAMQALVDYERELGHPDAEKHAAGLAELRSRIKG